MNKNLKLFLVVEIQVLLIIGLFLAFKINSVDEKVNSTNQYLFKVLVNKGIEEIGETDQTDITLGDQNAPVTIIMYSKFTCQYCKEFFETTFVELNDRYISKGIVKLVVRSLIPASNKVALFNAKCAQYAYKNNVYLEFSRLMVDPNSSISDTLNTKKNLFSLVKNTDDFNDYMNSAAITEDISKKVNKAHQAGVFRTPSFLIGGQVILGNRSFSRFDELIIEEISSAGCE